MTLLLWLEEEGDKGREIQKEEEDEGEKMWVEENKERQNIIYCPAVPTQVHTAEKGRWNN